MVLKKIGLKNSGATITSIVMTLLITIGIFTGMFLYLSNELQQGGQSLDPRYNDTYSKLLDQQQEINANAYDIKTGIKAVSEADSGIFSMGGLRGMLAVLQAPLVFMDTASETTQALILNNQVVPPFIANLAIIGIIVLIVLIIVAAIKGEQQKI